jgi:hypothetical protein
LRQCLCHPPCSQHFRAQYSTCTTLEIRCLFDLLAQLTMPSPTYCPCSHWIQPPLPQPYAGRSGSIVAFLFPLYTVYSVMPVLVFICMCRHCVPWYLRGWRHSQAISIHNCLLHVFVFPMKPFTLIEYHVPRSRCQWTWDIHSSSHRLQTWPTSCQNVHWHFPGGVCRLSHYCSIPTNFIHSRMSYTYATQTPWHSTLLISSYQVQIVSSLCDHHVLFMEYATLEVSFFSSLLLPAL